MKTSTVVMVGVLGLAATPLALHLLGGSTPTTRNWIKTLHGGGRHEVSAGSAGSTGSGGSEAAAPLQAPDKTPAPKAVPTISGKWTVTVTSDQGNLVLTMVLKQDGKTLTGTMTHPHGEGTLPVVGELVDRSLTFTVDAPPDQNEMHLAFKGAPKDDGSLAGTMTSAMGESKWTATRVKEKD